MRYDPTLRFTRLELQNWRNFGQCDLRLAGRVFIVGPNASGKSNLLDVFRFLHDLVRVGGGFQAAVQERGGVISLRALHARRFSQIRIRVEVGTDADRPAWGYELAFNASKNAPARIEAERVWHDGSPIVQRPDDNDRSDVTRLTQTAIEQINTNQQFRELAAFFGGIRYLHVVPQLIRHPDRVVHRAADPFGSDLIEQIAKTPKATREARLKRIAEALRVAVPQIKEIELEQDKRGLWHIRANYQHWRPQGAWQTEESFSDGTLRLLGLLWALQEKGGPLLLEEPELSLNAAVTQRVPTLFARAQRRGRQVIVTTHSEALLDDEGIRLDEVLLLTPQSEGTRVESASTLQDVRALLEGGLPMGEAVMPRVSPSGARQLSLLDI